MRALKQFSRWKGATPAGAIAFTSPGTVTDASPPSGPPNAAASNFFSVPMASNQGVPTGAILVLWTNDPGVVSASTDSISATLWLWEARTGTWHSVTAQALLPNQIFSFPVPSLLAPLPTSLTPDQATCGSIDGYVVLAGATPLGSADYPDGEYVFAIAGQMDVPASSGGGGGGGAPTGPAGGNLAGTYPNPTVAKINDTSVPAGGALTVGQVLRATGAAAAAWGALNLAAAAAVTGLLPTTNQAPQAMGGDVSGTTATAVVAKINGSTVPAGGALTTGNVLQVTGAGALGYAALNLAGGANFVTGALPAANQVAQTMAGDVTGTTAVNVVETISGNSGTGLATILNATALVHGTNPATAGNRRIKHAYVEQGRDNANANNRSLFDWGSATADTLTIGATTIAVAINGTSLAMAATPITYGTNPATAGTSRFAHASSAQGRDNANANNRNIWSWGSTTDTAIFGDAAVASQINATTCTLTATTFTVTATTQAMGATVTTYGTTPATAGTVRYAHNTSAQGRDTGNANNRNIWSWGATTDTAIFGDAAVAAQVNATTLTIGATTMALGTTVLTQGATVSGTGDMRVKHSWVIKGRNNANTADVTLMDWGVTVTNAVNVGAGTATSVYLQAASGGSVVLSCGAQWQVDNTSGFSSVANNAASALFGFGATLTTAPVIRHINNATGNAVSLTVRAQGSGGGNGNGGALILLGGALNGTGLRGGVQIGFNGVVTETNIELAELVSGRRVLAFLRGAVLTTTQMPTNTGDLVSFWGNCATAPTASPVSGGIVYEEGGAHKHYGSSGTTTTMAAA